MNAVNYSRASRNPPGKSSEGKSIQPLYGPRNGPLRRRAGHRYLRQDRGDGAMDREGTGARQDHRVDVTNGAVDRTRPLSSACGKVAKWNGSGSTDDAANLRASRPRLSARLSKTAFPDRD